MAEEEKKEPQAAAAEQKDQGDIGQVIEDLQKNSVPKEEYEKLKEQNLNLAKRLARGEYDRAKPEENPDYEAIAKDARKRFFDKNVTNIESAKAALELRKAEIALGHPDPFLPHGRGYVANKNDEEAADRVARELEECIEASGGDSSVFTAMFSSRMVDPNLPKKPIGRK